MIEEFSDSEIEFKKLKENPKERFKSIRELAIAIQDKKMKKDDIRSCAESIELLTDIELIEGINKSLEDFRAGRYTSIDNLSIADKKEKPVTRRSPTKRWKI